MLYDNLDHAATFHAKHPLYSAKPKTEQKSIRSTLLTEENTDTNDTQPTTYRFNRLTTKLLLYRLSE
ncbi:MAG: hypothetical protein COA42_02785 [Alteromonadaceae bacterium]|nr:MAG: hypothetical protein COA42_02785 [Alteromonadaceae bacterium]